MAPTPAVWKYVSSNRYAPALLLPPYSYVPGHGLPHPVNDPAGHLHAARETAHEPPIPPEARADLPADPPTRRRTIAALLTADPRWLFALDLFNGGFYWEAHEAWEGFWHALGRTSREAEFVQGLIHLAAAAVKIREGKPAGVTSHATRGRELMGQPGPSERDDAGSGTGAALGLEWDSITAVLAELEAYRPECWQTSRFPVVKVLASGLRIAGSDQGQSVGQASD